MYIPDGCEQKQCDFYGICESEATGGTKCVCPKNCTYEVRVVYDRNWWQFFLSGEKQEKRKCVVVFHVSSRLPALFVGQTELPTTPSVTYGTRLVNNKNLLSLRPKDIVVSEAYVFTKVTEQVYVFYVC
jgi:hypothetical protein